MKLLLIADENNAIAARGDQIVYLSKDLAHFKKTTWGQIVFMGPITYESIGRVLPGRINIVYTSRKLRPHDNLYVVSNHEDLKGIIELFPDREIYLIGGEKLTNLYIDHLKEAVITRVHHKFEGGDRFAPDFANLPHWRLKSLSKTFREDNYMYHIENWVNEHSVPW